VSTMTTENPKADEKKLKTFVEVALALLHAAEEFEEDDVLMGDATVGELAAFVFVAVGCCPTCGTASYTNLSCKTCVSVRGVVQRNLSINEKKHDTYHP
jgi:hypothetical protein